MKVERTGACGCGCRRVGQVEQSGPPSWAAGACGARAGESGKEGEARGAGRRVGRAEQEGRKEGKERLGRQAGRTEQAVRWKERRGREGCWDASRPKLGRGGSEGPGWFLG